MRRFTPQNGATMVRKEERKQLATIRVFLENDIDGDVSRMQKAHDAYEVILNPAADSKDLETARKATSDILAHELGHVVDALDSLFKPKEPAKAFAEEVTAWKYAAEMRPINTEIREHALAGYRKGLLGV
jgi:hypothetical protein